MGRRKFQVLRDLAKFRKHAGDRVMSFCVLRGKFPFLEKMVFCLQKFPVRPWESSRRIARHGSSAAFGGQWRLET
jgi:hypothetical protein